jgi:hypothetical protein
LRWMVSCSVILSVLRLDWYDHPEAETESQKKLA